MPKRCTGLPHQRASTLDAYSLEAEASRGRNVLCALRNSVLRRGPFCLARFGWAVSCLRQLSTATFSEEKPAVVGPASWNRSSGERSQRWGSI